jgi:hypothetical protein
MDRRNFLKLLGSLSVFSFLPIRSFLSPLVGKTPEPLTSEQLAALEKIREFEAQLEQQNGRFSWYLHNELRHYWGAFSEAKSLEHANIILEHCSMDRYILHTLSDWHYAADYGELCQPDLALTSLQRRAKTYPDLQYVRAACWLRAGEISAAVGREALAQEFYRQAILVGGKSRQSALPLSIYQHLAQARLIDRSWA